jgi:hypothetical protein
MVKRTGDSASSRQVLEAEAIGRRRFLRAAALMTAGGVVAATLPESSVVASQPAGVGPSPPVLPAAGRRTGEPHFFRIEPTAGRPPVAVDAEEV